MLSQQENLVLMRLYNAFRDIPKPEPLATLKHSYCHEEVDVFNAINWEAVTFGDYTDGHEGWIVCEPPTVAYLLPRLFRMIFQEHTKKTGLCSELAGKRTERGSAVACDRLSSLATCHKPA